MKNKIIEYLKSLDKKKLYITLIIFCILIFKAINILFLEFTDKKIPLEDKKNMNQEFIKSEENENIDFEKNNDKENHKQEKK
ncbi:hypothetical protein [Peptostreptococcus equinus]|uniref:Secreted protein n=1 Tax=Peptostreptococcus equinus TaxID=3003601 RepID=A0ABY7JLN4_9FIRM|nr:hypothetical protein [Peptostreptococcus sp. CBA3647]WAW14263.1 hypothetical protein O0R46_06525 [Peptostreptococcus sp. CBA3647]